MDLSALIRNVPDFPKPGIQFKDITTLLQNPAGFQHAVEQMIAPFQSEGVDGVAGIESRGFLFGAPMALALKVPFVPIRKPGKLPAETISASYTLEYGTDTIEMHADAFKPGDRVLLVDDLLATGGTMAAAVSLVQSAGAIPVGAAFLIELSFLGGRNKLAGLPVHALIAYEGE